MGKVFAATLVLLLMATSALGEQVFNGAWFKIMYPDGFVATGSQKSKTSDGFDGVFVRNPENTVEFYVFAPQWSGDPAGLNALIVGEKLVSESSTKGGKRSITWRTYAASNQSHLRSIEDTVSTDKQQRHVFAIRYRDDRELARYREAYQAFKASLEVYAD